MDKERLIAVVPIVLHTCIYTHIICTYIYLNAHTSPYIHTHALLFLEKRGRDSLTFIHTHKSFFFNFLMLEQN